MGLSESTRKTVQALGETFFPSIAAGDPGGGEILPGEVDSFYDTLSRDQRRGLDIALTLFDLGAVATRARRFHKLSPASREAYARRWSRSRIPARKIIFRGLKNTLALLYYQDSRTWTFIGYAGPKKDANGHE